ncbi:helicase-related protein, partial [Singulisphaera rosea]
HLGDLSPEPSGHRLMFGTKETNAIQRNRLGQVAKGFRYRKGKSKGSRRVERVDSLKPGFVADLIRSEAEAGLQVLVWTIYDAEADILAERLAGFEGLDLLTGKTAEKDRLHILERFRRGESKVLVSRASMLGYGMNFQNCGSMIFSGFNDSYESFYQAIRRAYRYGQLRRLRVHLPVVNELEGDMLENLWRKQSDHEAAIAEMERNYLSASRFIRGAA